MIKTFTDRRTKELYERGRERSVPTEITRRALIKLASIDYAATVEDLRQPPGNRLEVLRGDRVGRHSIRVNGQWRICFRYEDGAFYEVELTDYH